MYIYIAYIVYKNYIVQGLHNHRNSSIVRWSYISDMDFGQIWHCFGKCFQLKVRLLPSCQYLTISIANMHDKC